MLPTVRTRLGLLAATLLLAACESSPTGAAAEGCGSLPLFTHLPLAAADIDLVAVVGGLGAPGHTLPTAHAGIMVARVGTPVFSPGRLEVKEIRRVRYVMSPNRQGETDYAVAYQVCSEVEGWFGHVTSLDAASFPPSALSWGSCTSYNTAEETVENCFARPRDLWLAPGEPIGTAGMSAELRLMGYDVGLLDRRVNHFYVSRWRHPSNTFHAVCPWEYYDAASKAVLLGKIRDPGRAEAPEGEPRCGTMEVDVAGTAKGVWAETGVTTPAAGDERRYITLANNPYRPQLELALSLGPEPLGAKVALVPREPTLTGRVNRAFEQVTADGLIYCYGPPVVHFSEESWFLSLSASGTLTVERRAHAPGASPCLDLPASWSFTAASRTFVR